MFRYIVLFFTTVSLSLDAQWRPNSSSDNEVSFEVSSALSKFKANPELDPYFDNAYGFVVFPSIKKAGIGIGGASGKGQVFQEGELIGNSRVTQVSLGIQFGAQAFKEIIFFKDSIALDRFVRGNFEFGAQASAVALSAGVAVEVEYSDGVAIFTEPNGGLMYEASIGGQKFTFTPVRK